MGISAQTYDEEITIGTGGDYTTLSAFDTAYGSYDCVTNTKRLIVKLLEDLTGWLEFKMTTNKTYYVILDLQGYKITCSTSWKDALHIFSSCNNCVVLNGHLFANMSSGPQAACMDQALNTVFHRVRFSNSTTNGKGYVCSKGGTTAERGVLHSCLFFYCKEIGCDLSAHAWVRLVNCTAVKGDGWGIYVPSTASGSPNRKQIYNCVAYDNGTSEDWLSTMTGTDGSNNASGGTVPFGSSNEDSISSTAFADLSGNDFSPEDPLDDAGVSLGTLLACEQVAYTIDETDYEGVSWSSTMPIGCLDGGAGSTPSTFEAAPALYY